MERGGSVYIMTNKLRTVVYIGVTSELQIRIQQHKSSFFENSFTSKYNTNICVYYENYPTIEEAIGREKQLKGWRREKKDILISSLNPKWEDLWDEIRKW